MYYWLLPILWISKLGNTYNAQWAKNGKKCNKRYVVSRLGVKVRNMKMDFNIYGTWRWVMFEKLMMKIYDFLFG